MRLRASEEERTTGENELSASFDRGRVLGKVKERGIALWWNFRPLSFKALKVLPTVGYAQEFLVDALELRRP